MIRRLPPVARTVLGASAMTTLGTLPVFLLSSQSVFVRHELGFGEGRFGVVVGAFFVSAAAAALLGGRLVDRMGRRNSTVLAGLVTAVGGLGTAALARSWSVLVVGMLVLGVSNAACQVTSNLVMARVVPPDRRGLGFAVKQSAIPLALVLAGLAVPTVGALTGWRGTFVLTGVGGLVVAVVGARLPRGRSQAGAADQDRPDRPPVSALVTTMLAIALASAAANSLGSFAASWGFKVGLTPGQAGVLMAAGSAANVTVRILVGHRADRRHGRNLPVVAAQMLVGAVALAVLSIPSPVAVVPGALAGFALGWSWPGLLLYAVVRVGRDSPGTASGFVQAGAFAGGAAGPALFGTVVAGGGYELAWRLAALLFLMAAATVLLARRLFIADLVARPPAQPLGFGGGRDVRARTTGQPADPRAEDAR